jgi:hypothetical protein
MHFSAKSFSDFLKNKTEKMELIKEKIDRRTGHILKYFNPEELDQSEKDLLSFLGIVEKDLYRNILILRLPSASDAEIPTLENNPTAIICGGSGVWFTAYCPMIANLLINGMDVMAFSYRGYELSEGTPTEMKMYQDLETCFQYLKQEKKLKKDNLVLYASSLGLGVAAKFIEKYPQIQLIIDRSFASLGVVVESVLKDQRNALVSKAARLALPLIVDFRNASKLAKSRGNIFLVIDKNDSLIPDSESKALAASMPECKDCVYRILYTRGYDHDGNWLENPKYRASFEAFLLKSGKARKI